MSDAAYLEAALSALALRLRREVEVTRALRVPARRDQFLGLFLSEDDAAALCDEIAGAIAAGSDDALEAQIAVAEARLAAARARLPTLALARLGALFDLAALDEDLLLLAAAPAVDPRFGLVYGFLADDLTRRALTPALAQRIWADRGLSLLAIRAAVGPDGPLRRHALLHAEGADGPLAATPLRIEERILDLLMGRDRPDPALAPLIVDDAIPPAGHAVIAATANRPIVLLTERGADPALEAATIAGAAGLGVRRLPWPRWASVPPAELPVLLARALREIRLAAALPLFTDWDQAPDAARAAVVRAVRDPAIFAAATPVWRDAGLAAVELPIGPPPRAASIAATAAVIARHAPEESPALAIDLTDTYRLPAHEIAPLAAAAADSGDAFAKALRAAARRHAGRALAELAERIDDRQTFAALVLPPAPLAMLHDLVGVRATADVVLEQWGLGAAFNRRPGVVAPFSGSSGTGKTMAAGVVAQALGLDLYRIDLASVVSKYIGETERNLERIFAAAERSSAVLFFDEADALFGKRSEVQDARDRYANIEVSYLLQRIERFDGVAILATNLRQNLDDAFLRRIDFVVEFPLPQAADRLALWRRLADTAAPIDPDVDFAVLAQRFELTGGAIRNCVLAAAHAAAREAAPIAMRHLVAAVTREYLKQGQPLRKSLFGDLHAVPPADQGRVA